MAKLKGGQITIYDGHQRLSFGDSEAELQATVTIHNSHVYRKFVIGGGLGVSQSLIDGNWTFDDLTSLVRIFIGNLQVADRFDRGLARIRHSIARVEHWLRRNTRRNSKRNISQHYDVGNELYQLFLDETMNYSCGIFEDDTTFMQEASLAKMERICRKLDLQPCDHHFEIGVPGVDWPSMRRSCGNCHCPNCQSDKTQFWLAKRTSQLLPVPYFLVAFTVPQALREIVRANQQACYQGIFDAGSETIRELASGPRCIGTDRLGFFGALHTWGRDATVYHPHVHFVVTGGGVRQDGSQWQAGPANFLLPEKAASIVYRAKFREAMREAGLLNAIDPDVWKQNWVVNVEAVGDGRATLKYHVSFAKMDFFRQRCRTDDIMSLSYSYVCP